MYEYKCVVVNVVDGDTVDVEIDLGFRIKKINRIRLKGINTNELRSSDPVLRTAAYAARDRVAQLAPLVSRIKTEMDKDDKYGRLLGTLYMGDDPVPVNIVLLNEGLAVPYM